MYNQSAQAAGHPRSVRYRGAALGWSRQRQTFQSQEQVRLLQLAICLVLFLAIFLGKGAFPQKLERIKGDMLALISTDLDFGEALSELGESLAGSDTILSDFGTFFVEIFSAAPPEQETDHQVSVIPPQPASILEEELQFFSQSPGTAARTAHYADFSRFGLEQPTVEKAPAPEEQSPAEEAEVLDEPPAVPAAGTVIMVSDYSGDALPENYTMDQLSLGELETLTPVLGRLTSEYGYRDHPISGKYLFHGGIDISGNLGDPIACFAAGTVEYTGEDDSYGLYLQVDHGNGVKSFYAHCSKVVVSKGQAVAIGEKVAEIGSTGNSTGPHLHLELKFNKMHLNPIYYVELLEQ